MIEKFVPKELNITENAVLKVKHLIAEENKKNLHLRVFVTGGGCSGFQYGFKLDDIAEDDDTCLLYTSPSPRDLSTSRMPSSA